VTISAAQPVTFVNNDSVAHDMASTGEPHGRPIDVAHSTLTVFVGKSGMLSAFADSHVIRAPIASGSVSDEPRPGVELVVQAADLTVLDPDLSQPKRAEVHERMLGPEVLDAARAPRITFASSRIEPAGTDRWMVTGQLAIHGQTRIVTFPVARLNGRYTGSVQIAQRDFGIEPIRIAGGMVRVKDELRIQFDVATAAAQHGGPAAAHTSRSPEPGA
jgi:hypothetical protein